MRSIDVNVGSAVRLDTGPGTVELKWANQVSNQVVLYPCIHDIVVV